MSRPTLDPKVREVYDRLSSEHLKSIENFFRKLLAEGREDEYAKANEHYIRICYRMYGVTLGFCHLGVIDERDLFDLNLAFDERASKIREKYLPLFDAASVVKTV